MPERCIELRAKVRSNPTAEVVPPFANGPIVTYVSAQIMLLLCRIMPIIRTCLYDLFVALLIR